jgi:hypothetical protein
MKRTVVMLFMFDPCGQLTSADCPDLSNGGGKVFTPDALPSAVKL